MADFGGFNVPTPQEVLAGLQAQQQAIARLPADQRRNANIQFQMANLFGNPELKKARASASAMEAVEQAMSESPHSPGSQEWQAERLNRMFMALKDTHPDAAAQIAQEMTALDEERFQRRRLSQADQRAQEAHNLSQLRGTEDLVEAGMNNLQNSIQYVRTEGPGGKETFTPFDVATPEGRAGFIRARREPGSSAWSRDEVVDYLGKAPGYEDFLNKSDISKQRDTLRATTASYNRGARLLAVLADNPAANTNISALDGVLNEVANDARQALQRTGDFVGISDNSALHKIDAVLSGIEDFSQEYASDKTFWQALTLNMAYTLARSLDPSGRLSDFDVEFAGRMIAKTKGQPAVLARVMTEQFERTYQDNAGLGNKMRELSRRSPGQNYIVNFADDMDEARAEYYRTLRRGGWISEDELNAIINPGQSRKPVTPTTLNETLEEDDDDDDDFDPGF